MDSEKYNRNKEIIERLLARVKAKGEFGVNDIGILVNYDFENNLSNEENLNNIIGPEYSLDTLTKESLPIATFYTKFDALLSKYQLY